MKKAIFLLLVAATALRTQAQNRTDEYIYLNEQEYSVYAADYTSAKTTLENFIRVSNYPIIKQSETKNSHYYEFNIPAGQYVRADSLIDKLGYTSSKQLNSFSYEEKLEAAGIDLAFLENKKKEYEALLVRMDTVKSDKYYNHWEKIRDIETDIANTRKKIAQLQKISPLYRVKVTIYNETLMGANAKITFVSMPGLSYSCLFTENPKAGISEGFYQGASLKYLFTKGKSYFMIGILKSDRLQGDDSVKYATRTEIFNFTFGQDFYSKRFGRGTHRFFNLYASYQTGLSLYYSQKNTITIPFLNPGIGVEIFKNKNILLDCNTYYFLPLSDDINRNLRGWMPSLSFNFVF